MAPDRCSSATADTNAGDQLEPRRVDASALFVGAREVILVHEGQIYRLRITSSGKLILTK
jgi:hemin uptake protein HemP